MTTRAFARSLLISLLWLPAAPATPGGPEDRAGQGEATSLLGRELTRPELPGRVTERHESAIRTLRRRLAAHPDDADALVWIGRHLGYLGRYREAIAVFDEGVERFPGEASSSGRSRR